MKTQWNELKCLHETAKINSMTETAQALHREGLCDLSAIRTTSADVEKKWIPSRPLSCTSLVKSVSYTFLSSTDIFFISFDSLFL